MKGVIKTEGVHNTCECTEPDKKIKCIDIENFPARWVITETADKTHKTIEMFHIWRCKKLCN